MTERSICPLFMKITELAIALGSVNLNSIPGCWICDVDDQWTIVVNGHSVIQSVSAKGARFDVYPFNAVVLFNGLPAANLSPFEGIIVDSECASERILCDAIDARILREKAEHAKREMLRESKAEGD